MVESSERPNTDTGETRPGAKVAVLALTMAVFFWSGNFVAGRALGGRIEPVDLNAVRWTLAAIILVPIAWPDLRRDRCKLVAHWPQIVGLGALGIAFFHICVYSALRQIPVTNALLLLALCPMVILVGSAIMGIAALSGRDVLAVCLSFCGVAILLSEGQIADLMRLHFVFADLWVILAVFAWAAYTLLLSSVPKDIAPRAVLASSILVGVVFMLPLALVFGHFDPSVLTFPVISAILYIVICASVLAYIAWSAGVRRIGPGAAGQFINLMPAFGALLAWIVLGEPLHVYQVVGAAGILLAIILSKPLSRQTHP